MKLQNPYLPPTPDEAIALAGVLRPGAVFWADPIAKAVDDYLLMERKARAWDQLRTLVGVEAPSLSRGAWAEVEWLDAMVHPAHNPSTR